MKTALILFAILLSQSVIAAPTSFNGQSVDIQDNKIVDRTFSVQLKEEKLYLTFDSKGIATITVETADGYFISSEMIPIQRLRSEGSISYLAEPLEGCYTLDGKRYSLRLSSFRGQFKPKQNFVGPIYADSLVFPPMELFINVSRVNQKHVVKITKDPFNY